MSDVDISRERIERLKAMGIADYIHIALLDKIDRLTEERDQALSLVEAVTERADSAEKSLREAKACAAAAALEMRERAAESVAGWSLYTIEGDPFEALAAEEIRALPIDPDAQAALDKLIREAEQRGQIKAGGVFADTDPEARYIEDMQNACPACEGSGHKDDGQAALDKLIADARADAFREALKAVSDLPSGKTDDVQEAHEQAYRAILARINEPQEGGK